MNWQPADTIPDEVKTSGRAILAAWQLIDVTKYCYETVMWHKGEWICLDGGVNDNFLWCEITPPS